MGQYYYTTAALPTIMLGDKAPISEERFLEFAEDTLEKEDFLILCRSRLDSFEPTGSVFADRILAWEQDLRLELARVRLEGLKFEPLKPLPPFSGQYVLTEKARTALAMSSPLEAEVYLNQERWTFLEEKAVSHFFDLEAILVYYFKLQIALRQEKFQKDRGQQVFSRTYDAVAENFHLTTL